MYHKRMRDKKALEFIDYEVLDFSSQASSYYPENIKTNDPTDPNSRWSTVNNDHRQFITLKCEEGILATITFGKFCKIHVCNLKEMRISVSYDNILFTEVFYGGLRNDTEPETFNLLTEKEGQFLISRYVKIEPLAAWGMNFNYSIWYVELRGVLDVKDLVISHKRKVKEDMLRNCLRALKRLGYSEEYASLSQKIKERDDNRVLLEIKSFLDKEDFEGCEEFVLNLDESLFDSFIKQSGYFCMWEEIKKNIKEGEEGKRNWPCERGGHQMVSLGGKVFLYGGWNGIEELGDFWVYNGKEWECIIPDQESINSLGNNFLSVGPGKRSCHKLTTDGERIYMIGRYVSSISRDSKPIENEIWVYDRGWYVLRTKNKEVPSNTYDHYVSYGQGGVFCFGGKQTDDDETYGGLYRIDVSDLNPRDVQDSTSQKSCIINETSLASANSSGFFDHIPERWSVIREDAQQEQGSPILRGRLGHSMIFIPEDHVPGCRHNNSLVIVGGQRGKENFKEIQFYAIDTDTVYETVQFPIKTEGRIIQRSVLYKEDIIILFTYGKEKDSKLDTFSIFSYSLRFDKWSEIPQEGPRPLPRSAHQFVPFGSDFLLFGGNVVDKSDKRQNDLWRLRLKRVSRESIRKLAQFTIRKHKFLHLLDRNKQREAVDYLRTFIKPLIEEDVDSSMVLDKLTFKDAFDKLCYEFFDRQDESDAFEEVSKLFLNKS